MDIETTNVSGIICKECPECEMYHNGTEYRSGSETYLVCEECWERLEGGAESDSAEED
jgi:hypothetical protein